MLRVRYRLAGDCIQCFIYFDPETQSDRAATVNTEAVTAEGEETKNVVKHTLAPKAPTWKCCPSLLSISH